MIQKSHLEMMNVVFNVFIVLYKPLQEFKAVSVTSLGPETEEEKPQKFTITHRKHNVLNGPASLELARCYI